MNDCKKRGHDWYMANDPDPFNKLGLIKKCIYCKETRPIFKKKK